MLTIFLEFEKVLRFLLFVEMNNAQNKFGQVHNRDANTVRSRGVCGSGGSAGHLLIGWFDLTAPVCVPNTLGQDTNPELLSDISIRV